MKKTILIFTLLILIGGLIYFFQKNESESLTQKYSKPAGSTEETEELSDYSEKGIYIEIIQPKDQSVVNEAEIIIKGKTASGAEVFINDLEIIADNEGGFEADIVLDEGENTIIIVANDIQGNFAEKELTINLESLE